MNCTIHEVILAGWLHDIGKFSQRAGIDKVNAALENALCPLHAKEKYYTHQHVIHTFDFFDKMADIFPEELNTIRVRNLAAHHHKNSDPDDEIISLADRLSSGMDRRTDKELLYEFEGKYYEKPLLHIISTIEVFKKRAEKTAYVPLEKHSPCSILAREYEKLSKEHYRVLWQQFEKDFMELKGMKAEPFLEALDTLLQQYLWCIPSTTMDDPDVSLYQHCKTTAAFAAAIYRLKEQNPDTDIEQETPFIILQGDVSGIQNYIFDLPSAKNNAKLLRARSFQIQMFSLSLARYITKKFEVGFENVMTAAGGRFMIILPDAGDIDKKIDGLREEIDLYTIEQFTGRIAFILTTTKVTGTTYLEQRYGEVLLNMMAQDEQRQKLKRLQQGIAKKGGVLHDMYRTLQSHGKLCAACGWLPADSESSQGFCSSCEDLVSKGTQLTGATQIHISSDTLKPFKSMVTVKRKADDSWGYLSDGFIPGKGVLYLPYLAPTEDGSVLSFDQIAQRSTKNLKRVAMLKADVDNLGLLFRNSFNKRWSISRYAELSSLFNQFFSAYLVDFIKKDDRYKDKIYVLFSGGDDLCLFGPWEVVMDFALSLRKELDRFSYRNTAVSISAGIVLVGSSTSIGAVAHQAEEELESAKGRRKGDRILKDGISVFGTTLSWVEYETSLADGKTMEGLLNAGDKNNVSISLVYKLLDFSQRAKNAASGNLRDALWMSNYQYLIERVLGESRGNEKENDQEIKQFFKKFGLSPIKMEQVKVAATYALYSVREGKGGI